MVALSSTLSFSLYISPLTTPTFKIIQEAYEDFQQDLNTMEGLEKQGDMHRFFNTPPNVRYKLHTSHMNHITSIHQNAFAHCIFYFRQTLHTTLMHHLFNTPENVWYTLHTTQMHRFINTPQNLRYTLTH